jgi:hypothetical protein
MARGELPYARGDRLIAEYREKFGEQTLLGFSRGKDSIATALLLRDKLDVWPVFFYAIPGLTWIEEGLEYYSKHLFNGRRIIQYPEGAFFRWLCSGVYQTPHTMEIIRASGIGMPAQQSWWREITSCVIEDEGLNEKTLAAVGIRGRDSPFRWFNVKKHGPLRPHAKNWLPIWDYPKEKCLREIEQSGISLPLDYFMFGRSFGGGLDARFLVPVKRYRPQDFKIICEYFPLAEVCVWKYERFIEEGKRCQSNA